MTLDLSRSRTVGASLWRSSRVRPHQPAILDLGSGVEESYAQLNASADRLALGFDKAGASMSSPVVAVMENSIEFIWLYFALAKLGVTIVPLSFRSPAAEIERTASHVHAGFIVADSTHATRLGSDLDVGSASLLSSGHGQPLGWAPMADLMAEVAGNPQAEVGDDDVFALMSTAGTTGRPKLSVKTHGEYAAAADSFLLRLRAFLDVEAPVRYLVTTPIFHGGAFVLVGMAISAGWSIALMPAFDAQLFAETVASFRPAITWLVPTMLATCLDAGIPAEALSSIEVIISAGAPLDPGLRRRAEQTWPHVIFLDVYGQTEACGPISSPRDPAEARRTPHSLGVPIRGIELTVRAMDGAALGPGELGELCYRGPMVARSYFDNPEANARAFADGWFHSGDLGHVDEAGRIYLVDRMGDMIITGGENVFPSAVEEVLAGHPDVVECCVFGLPDPTWGQRIAAAVVMRAGALTTDEELDLYARQQLAGHMRPRSFFRVVDLPKSPVGKVLRRVARDDALAVLESRGSSNEEVDSGGGSLGVG